MSILPQVGDPSKGHSVATVRLVAPTVLSSANESVKTHMVSARDILSYSRVQNHVAKMALYVYDPLQASNGYISCVERSKPTREAGTQHSAAADDGLKYISINFHRVGVRI